MLAIENLKEGVIARVPYLKFIKWANNHEQKHNIVPYLMLQQKLLP